VGTALSMCAPGRVQYRTVCYRCRYLGPDTGGNKCPVCGFPLIRKVGEIPAAGLGVEQIFDRVSVRVGAPPLPGVDGGPRKAQLLAEARRRRRSHKFAVARAMEQQRFAMTRRNRAAKVAFAFVSAFLAGLFAAVVVNGGL
jgi:hypothetical protein